MKVNSLVAERSSKDSRRKRCFKRHHFEQELLKKLATCYKLDNWHGFLEVCEDWGIIALTIVVSIWSWQNFSTLIGSLVYFIAVVIIGARQHGIADLLHQSAHETLAKNKHFNRILGTFASGYFVFQSFTGYRASHIFNHHPRLGDSTLDPDYDGLLQSQLYGEGLTNGSVYRYLLTLWHPATVWNYLCYLVKNRILNPGEQPRERAQRIAYLTVVFSIICFFGFGHLLFAYWIIPFLTTANWTGCLVELAEHYPLMETAPKVDIYMSRNRLCSPWTNFFVGKHWDGYHLIHHLFPSIPSWRYKEAHKILLEDETYARLNQEQGWRLIFKHMLSPMGPLKNSTVELASLEPK